MRNRLLAASILLSAMGVVAAQAQLVTFSDREPRYLLQPSDTLEIHYRYSPEFDQTVAVQPDGFLVLSLLGAMKVQGLTLDQVKTAILEKASERLRDPEITVALKDFEKPYFIVGGEVAAPGRFEMRGTVNAIQAIAMAGGLKTASAKHSQVILFRKIGSEMASTEIIDLKTAMNGHAKEPLVNLKPGDMLVVPQNRISKIDRIIKVANLGAYFPL